MKKRFFRLMASIFHSFLGLCLLVLLSCGGGGGSETPKATQTEINHPPVAVAGPNQNVSTGSTVTLDGSGSYDPDNDSLTYSWALTQVPNGSTATLSNANAVRTTFIPNVNGTYVARLIVTDNRAETGATSNEDPQKHMASEASYVIITASTTNDVFVAMGGSTTIGYSVGYNNSYVARLSRMWGKAALDVAVMGAKSSDGVSLIGTVLSKHNPRYLTLYYGTNEVGSTNVNDLIVSNLRFIITKAKANGTIPVVATLGLFLGRSAWRQPSAIELNKKIRQMALQEGIPCADLEAALHGNSNYMLDDIHPNNAGHQVIADAFYKALTQ